MVRKFLIIFALIIAVFPYLGFSDSADHVVTTVFSLLIALALILGKKPKTIKPVLPVDHEPRNIPPITPVQPQEVKIVREEQNNAHNINFNNASSVVTVNHEPVLITEQPPVDIQMEVPVQKPKITRRRVVSQKPTNIVQDVLMSEPAVNKIEQPQIENVLTIRKRQRKSVNNTILANEDSVPPADIPVAFE